MTIAPSAVSQCALKELRCLEQEDTLVSTGSYPRVTALLRLARELPLVWFLAGYLLARLSLLLSSLRSPQDRSILLRRVALASGLFVLFTYLAITLCSLRCFMMQLDEANILSISAATFRGLPMYQLPTSPVSSYSLVYGPFTFLIYLAALLMGGVSHFWIVRGFAVAANLGLCAALYRLLRRFVSAGTAVALLALPLSALLQHAELALSARSDIWVTLFAALAILCSYLDGEVPAVILVGIMGGLILDLKISAAPALFYPLLILYRRFGLRSPVAALLVMAAGALTPFTLHNISLHNYVAWILFTRSEGIAAANAWINFFFALFLIAPCVIMEIAARRLGLALRPRLPELLLIVLCLFLALLTSKGGSGPHYLWHIMPSIVVYLALVCRDMASLTASEQIAPVYLIAVACALFACVNVPRAWQQVKISLMPPGVPKAEQSIQQYLSIYRNRSSIQMGYGSVAGDYRSELRYILVYRGQPYTVEGNTGRFDTRLLPFPVDVLNRMEHCRDDVWLAPHAQAPFALWVLPDSLRSAFLANYSIDRTDGIYDAWTCNRGRSQ